MTHAWDVRVPAGQSRLVTGVGVHPPLRLPPRRRRGRPTRRGTTPPARQARAEAQLQGQVLPLDAGVRRAEDPATAPANPGSGVWPRPAWDLACRGNGSTSDHSSSERSPRPRVPVRHDRHDKSNEQPDRQSHDRRYLSGPLSPAQRLGRRHAITLLLFQRLQMCG